MDQRLHCPGIHSPLHHEIHHDASLKLCKTTLNMAWISRGVYGVILIYVYTEKCLELEVDLMPTYGSVRRH